MVTVEYDSNNSGGEWWLKDEHWEALERAGWVVHWVSVSGWPYDHSKGLLEPRTRYPGKTFLGASATTAAKQFPTLQAGIEEWEEITGQDPTAEGCNCCGQPHSFREID